MIINGTYTDMDGRPIDRFAIEQAIHEAWHLVDDLRLLTERLEYMNEDQIFSVVHGLAIFADMRFNKLWNTFEQCLSNGGFNSEHKLSAEITEAMDEAVESFGQEKL